MGLDTVELVMDVEDHFGIVLREEDGERIRTISDLADAVFARIVASTSLPCPSIRVFYELRARIRNSLGSPQLRMRPSTSLNELLPISSRKRCWEIIRAQQPHDFPNLELPRTTSRLLVASLFLIFAIPLFILPMNQWVVSIPISSVLSIVLCIKMNRYRSEIPKSYSTVGDLVKSSLGTVVATKKLQLTTKELVLLELLPIIAEQFRVDIKTLTPQTRFREDLQAD